MAEHTLRTLPRYHGKTEALIREALANPDLKIVCASDDAARLLVARGIPAGQILTSAHQGGTDADL